MSAFLLRNRIGIRHRNADLIKYNICMADRYVTTPATQESPSLWATL